MWFQHRSDEARLACPTCGVVGRGMRLSTDEHPPYFCMACLRRSDHADEQPGPGKPSGELLH